MAKRMFTVARLLLRNGPAPMTTEAELESVGEIFWGGPVWRGHNCGMLGILGEGLNFTYTISYGLPLPLNETRAGTGCPGGWFLFRLELRYVRHRILARA